MKVLLVKLSALGDIVHAFPAVEEAVEHLPDIEIDWLANAKHVELVRQHPGVRRVLAPNTPRGEDGDPYDVVIDAQGLLRSAFLARGRGRSVTGADGKHVREWPSHLLYTHRVSYPDRVHAVDEVRCLFGAALGYDVRPAERAATNLRHRPHRNGRRIVPLFHGTAQRCKLWPAERWRALARELVARDFDPVVVAQSDDEVTFCADLVSTIPQVRFLAGAGIPDLRNLIDEAAFCVSVDTGLGHLADWLGCPTLMLFQASDPIRTGTYFSSSRSLWAGPRPERPRRRDRNRACRHEMVSVEAALAALHGWAP